jgi:hypothetical protein
MNPLLMANRKRGFDDADANVQWLESFHRSQPPPVDPATTDLLYCRPVLETTTDKENKAVAPPRRVSIPTTEISVSKPTTNIPKSVTYACLQPDCAWKVQFLNCLSLESYGQEVRFHYVDEHREIDLTDFVVSNFVALHADKNETASGSSQSDKPKGSFQRPDMTKLTNAKMKSTDNGKLVETTKNGYMPYASYPCPCCRTKFAFLKSSFPPMTAVTGRISDQMPWDPKVFSAQIARVRIHFQQCHKNIPPSSWPPGFNDPGAPAKPSSRAYVASGFNDPNAPAEPSARGFVYYRCPCCPSKFGFSKSKYPPLNVTGHVTGQVPWDPKNFAHQIQKVRDHFVMEHPEMTPLYWPIGFRAADRGPKGHAVIQPRVSTKQRPPQASLAPHPYSAGTHPAWQVPSYWQPPPPHMRARLPATYAKGPVAKGTAVPGPAGAWPAHYGRSMPNHRQPVLPKKVSTGAAAAKTANSVKSQPRARPSQTVATGKNKNTAPSKAEVVPMYPQPVLSSKTAARATKVVKSQRRALPMQKVATGGNAKTAPPPTKVAQLQPKAPSVKADVVGSGFLSLLAAAEVASPLPSGTNTVTLHLPAPVSLENELTPTEYAEETKDSDTLMEESITKSTDMDAVDTSMLDHCNGNNTDSDAEDSSGSAASPNQNTADDELDVFQLSRTGKNIKVHYHCPIKSCPYTVAFDKRKAPPLSKDGKVLDKAPWIQSRFKRQVVKTRKHMQLCHKDFPREHFPTGFAFNSELMSRGFQFGWKKSAKQNEEKVSYHCSVEGCRWEYGIPAHLKPPMKDGRVSDQAEWPWGWLEIQIRGVRQHFRRNHPHIHRSQWPPCIAADRVRGPYALTQSGEAPGSIAAKPVKSKDRGEKEVVKAVVKDLPVVRATPIAETFIHERTGEKLFTARYKCSVEHCRWQLKFETQFCPPLDADGLVTDQVPWDRGRFLQIYRTVKDHFQRGHPLIHPIHWPEGINDAGPPKKRSRIDQPVADMTASKAVGMPDVPVPPTMYCQIIDQSAAASTDSKVAANPKDFQPPTKRPSARGDIGLLVAAMADPLVPQSSTECSPTAQPSDLNQATDGTNIVDSRDAKAIGLLMLAQASRAYDGSTFTVVI